MINWAWQDKNATQKSEWPSRTPGLMCGSGCALSSSSEQILCCNKRYQRNSAYFNAFFLESKVLSFLRSSHLLSFPLRVCFFSSHTLVSFTSVSFFSLYVRKTTFPSALLSGILHRCNASHLRSYFSISPPKTLRSRPKRLFGWAPSSPLRW